MVAREKEVEEIIKYKHKIYCDNCNKLLAEVYEDEFGYYKNKYEKEIEIPIHRFDKRQMLISRCVFNKDLCEDCYNKFTSDLQSALVHLGFKLV